MVAKISHGASLYGALVYNHEKVFQGTAEILSGYRMISDRPGLPSEDMRLALLSFENHLTVNRRTDKPVLHIALSPAPEDRLDNDRLAELAEKYMQKMGYGDQPFIVYRHGDTCNTHVHIVSVCIDDEGKSMTPMSTAVPWPPAGNWNMNSDCVTVQMRKDGIRKRN